MKRFFLLSMIVIMYNVLSAQNLLNTEIKNVPQINIFVDNVTTNSLDVTFTPNEYCAYYHYLLGTEEEMEHLSQMMGLPVDEIVSMWTIGDFVGVNNYNYTQLNPNTEYVIYARPFTADSVAYPMDTLHVITEGLGGSGLSIIELMVSEITENSVLLTAIPNEETAEYHDGLITNEYFEEIGKDSTVKIMQSNQTTLYDTDIWTWQGLETGTAYKAIGIGKNALDQWGDTTIIDFSTLTSSSVDDVLTGHINLYPQPNNGNFTLESSQITNETIKIFDVSGRIVHEEDWISKQQDINVSHLKSGIYFLQTELGKTAQKFIIEK